MDLEESSKYQKVFIVLGIKQKEDVFFISWSCVSSFSIYTDSNSVLVLENVLVKDTQRGYKNENKIKQILWKNSSDKRIK